MSFLAGRYPHFGISNFWKPLSWNDKFDTRSRIETNVNEHGQRTQSGVCTSCLQAARTFPIQIRFTTLPSEHISSRTQTSVGRVKMNKWSGTRLWKRLFTNLSVMTFYKALSTDYTVMFIHVNFVAVLVCHQCLVW